MKKHPLLAYYVGAYGSTIRIDTQTREELAAIRQLFEGLASGEVKERDLGEALACKLDSIHSLIVQSVPTRGKDKALVCRRQNSQRPAFLWTNNYDEWLDCMEKVEVLMRSDSPGHQFLTHEGLDDALVELCYKE